MQITVYTHYRSFLCYLYSHWWRLHQNFEFSLSAPVYSDLPTPTLHIKTKHTTTGFFISPSEDLFLFQWAFLGQNTQQSGSDFMPRVKGLAMRDNTPRPMIPSVSPLIRAAPDATSRICSTLWTRVPSRRAWCSQVVRRYRFRMWHMVESDVSSTEAAGMLQTAIPADVEGLRSDSLYSKHTHTLLCIVCNVMENLLNHYLSLQQTLCRYYQSRSQCVQLYEVLWTFPGPPSSGWWCGTWEHPLLHLTPKRIYRKYSQSMQSRYTQVQQLWNWRAKSQNDFS